MKVFHNRVNYILLSLLIISELVILIIYSIPNLNHTVNFVKSIEDLIIAGYVSDIFWQNGVIYGLIYCIFHTLTYILIIIFSVITLFKHRMIKIVGNIIIIQNIMLLSLTLWHKFLINELNETVVIDIEMYIFITIFLTAFVMIVSLRKKKFYLTLSIITILQLINTINFAIEHIASIYITSVMFVCFSEILILNLYWLVLCFIKKDIELYNDQSDL